MYAGLGENGRRKKEGASLPGNWTSVKLPNLDRSMRSKNTQPTSLFQPLQNTYGGFQPLTDVPAPKTNTETNIYRALKSQQKSPGHKVSLPGPEISGLGLLNRMSHLVSIAGQETLAPKGD